VAVYGPVAAGGGSGNRAGDTVLIVKVAEAEPVVGQWRTQFDPSAAAGVPAHVTVLAPFLDRALVDASVSTELDILIGEHRPFDVELAECRRFPGVLYLAPVPSAPLRALTVALAGRWPEAPPYRGQFAEVVPHLTVARGQEPDVLDRVEAEVACRLPVTARIESVLLMAYTGDRWEDVRGFPLADGGQGRGR
jgi:2'-5' RNA ligase